MRILIQRVSRAKVTIEGNIHGTIARGVVALVGVTHGDTPADAQSLARKTARLRIFPDEQERMNLSLMDINGQALVISQFTLYADTRKGNRPSFIEAAPPQLAEALYEQYVEDLSHLLPPGSVQTGRFRANMQVELINDGPITIALSSDPPPKLQSSVDEPPCC